MKATAGQVARGNRREEIVRGDDDRGAFVRLLGELVERTDWEMFAWVLSLQTTLRRGWYFGAEGFREKMLEKLGSLKGNRAGRHPGFHIQSQNGQALQRRITQPLPRRPLRRRRRLRRKWCQNSVTAAFLRASSPVREHRTMLVLRDPFRADEARNLRGLAKRLSANLSGF